MSKAIEGNTLNGNGLFKLPGPTLSDTLKLNGKNAKDFVGDVISIQIANYFLLKGAILTSVTPKFINKLDVNGKPLEGSISLTFKSAWTLTADQVMNCFIN